MSKRRSKKQNPKPSKTKTDQDSVVVSFRADMKVLGQLEAYTAELKEQSPGAVWSIHTAAKNGLVVFLNEREGGE